MPQLSDYEVYIFDCDGVILDSNQLKIEAMKNALEAHFSAQDLIAECVDYFRHNFGKSRFHHVAHFLDSILTIEKEKRSELEQRILADFSKQCRTLYLTAQLTPGFMSFLEKCKGKRYVASGSEQSELRDVFIHRDLDKYFDGVFGSPTPKAEIIHNILKQENNTNVVMFGDAMSDLESARINNCAFIAYVPFSSVKKKLKLECKENSYVFIESWSELEC